MSSSPARQDANAAPETTATAAARPGNDPPVTRQMTETADYIADLLLELRSLARQANLRFLVYLLEMAFEEAFAQAQRKGEAGAAARVNQDR